MTALALVASLAASAAAAQTACQRSPLLVGACFWVHGRYSAWAGVPSYRVWRVGTRHVFGVHDSDNTQAFMYPPPPPEVRAAMPAGSNVEKASIWGDFLLCPFTRARAGRMQYACIAKATRLIARPLAP